LRLFVIRRANLDKGATCFGGVLIGGGETGGRMRMRRRTGTTARTKTTTRIEPPSPPPTGDYIAHCVGRRWWRAQAGV